MSIFKKAIDYLTGKKEEKEFQKKLTEGLEELLKKNIPQEFVIKQEDCKQNRLIYNVNQKSLTVISCNNDTFSGFNIEPEQLESFRNADNETIIRLLTPPKQEVLVEENIENQEKELVSNFLDIFEGVDDFEVTGNSVYFKGIKSVEIPSLIVARFVELIEKISYYKEQFFDDHAAFETEDTLQLTSLEQEYQSLKAFTLKLLTSPREESIAQVLSFCRHNDLRISKRGNIIAYRRVREYKDVSMPDNLELIEFVKESVEKIKKWKKSLKNYWVHQTHEDGILGISTNEYTEHNDLGNLYELYNNQSVLKPETVKLYSSKHDYGKYTFAIGDVYKANEDDIDVDAGQCHSGGLHFASVNYNYSSYGEIPIVVLINPAKTITIPLNELAKGRTTEMKIACINPNEQGVHIDESLIEEADEQYDEYTLEELQQVISQKTLKPLSVEEEVTNLSIPEVVNIKELLSKRVVTI